MTGMKPQPPGVSAMLGFDLHEFDMQAVHHACALNLLDVAAAISVHDLAGARSAWRRYLAAMTMAEDAGGNHHTINGASLASCRPVLAGALANGDLNAADLAVRIYMRHLAAPPHVSQRLAA